MSVLRLPGKTCDHTRLMKAIHESGLQDARGREIKVEVHKKTFLTTSALAQLCAWGLTRAAHGCGFRFLGEPGALSYPARVQLFQHLGFDHREPPAREDDELRFIPLRLLTDRGASVAQAVDAVCTLVSAHVHGSERFIPALRWVVQEITDNVGNHAASASPGVLCAQLYPRKKRVEIAICDMGQGIKASLASSGRYPRIYSHGDAITKAMEAGVTRDLSAGQGNGLSGSLEIVMANSGDLRVFTGDADRRFKNGTFDQFTNHPEFPGTGVFISLRTDHPVDLRTTSLFDRTETSLADIVRPLAGDPPGPGPDTESASGPRVIVVALACEHVGGREPGLALRRRLERETRVGQGDETRVAVDFAGIDMPSSSFLDEVFGRFADQHGRDRLERLVEVRTESDLIPGMIRRVVLQRQAQSSEAAAAKPSSGAVSTSTSVSTTASPSKPVEPRPVVEASKHLRSLLGKVCPATSALYVGTDDGDFGVESWWSGLLGRKMQDLHTVALHPGWTDAVQGTLSDLAEPVLLVPAWTTDRDLAHELLSGHGSIASALVFEVAARIATGRGIYLLLPTGIISSQRDIGLRNELWNRDILRTVVSFSNRLQWFSGAHSGFEVSLLYLSPLRSNETPHSVAMIDLDQLAAQDALDKATNKALQMLLGPFGKGGEFGYRFIWDDPARPLRYKSHDPNLRERERELQAVGLTVSLGDLLESCGLGIHSVDATSERREGAAPYRVIGGREVRLLRDLGIDELKELHFAAPTDDHQVRPGDLLLGRIQDLRRNLRVGVVPRELAGAVAMDTVFVLRFASERIRDFVADYLQSDFVRQWLDAEGHGFNLTLSSLQSLPVPAPESRIARIVQQLSTTSTGLRRVADQFDSQRRALFGFESLREQLASSEETSLIAATLDRAISSLDDMSARVRTLFPLPLALAWRVMELSERPSERYSALLKLAEATVNYLAVMVVADLRVQAAQLEIIPGLLSAFRTPKKGPSMGAWLLLLRQAPPLDVSQALDSSAFPELRLLLGQRKDTRSWWRRMDSLKDRRDDHAHGRGPQTDGQYRAACAEAEAELREVYQRLGFLARYRLTQVLECTFDELDGTRTARIKHLAGDHGVAPVAEQSVDREIGPGLYFVNARDDLTLASPWLRYDECRECGHLEVFIPEYYAEEGEGVVYRRLRTGHLQPPRPGSLVRLARFVGAEVPEPPTPGT